MASACLSGAVPESEPISLLDTFVPAQPIRLACCKPCPGLTRPSYQEGSIGKVNRSQVAAPRSASHIPPLPPWTTCPDLACSPPGRAQCRDPVFVESHFFYLLLMLGASDPIGKEWCANRPGHKGEAT